MILTVLALSGCAPVAALPTATIIPIQPSSTPSELPSATLTASPTATFTPLPPTSTPTLTPTQTITPTLTSTPTPPPTPSGEDAIYIYVIQLGNDGPLSCGDTAVKINTGQRRTGDVAADAATALKRLFNKKQFYGRLVNPAYLSNIEVESIDFKAFEGILAVRLRGTYVRSGDRCDDGRVRAQVWSTLRQFPGVKTLDILLNGNLLGDILATGK
ncbi:MAG: hypothetical protein L0Z70_12110 [Chloroflexi bacterium]|nr:hypothetical protein [Chloroflexota bacterium]